MFAQSRFSIGNILRTLLVSSLLSLGIGSTASASLACLEQEDSPLSESCCAQVRGRINLLREQAKEIEKRDGGKAAQDFLRTTDYARLRFIEDREC